VLFFGTLRENILIGDPQAGDAQMLSAAHIGGADVFANLHPKGFDMQVGERGCNLSSGQREAVAIARAVIKNPNILMLDEPTASMDSASESLVCRNIAAISKDKTVMLVTHRAALLELVSRIIVIDAGHVVADGPRDKVLAASSRVR
jgi:ATP-binding cassette subfamily C protein LapB